MRRGLAAAIAATIVVASTAAYADEIGSEPPPTRVLVTYSNDIDGPMVFVAQSWARDRYGAGVSVIPIHTWSILDTPADQLTELPTCVVAVGADGQEHGEAWQGAIELAGGDAGLELAVGADRYATAQQVGDAIDRCVGQ